MKVLNIISGAKPFITFYVSFFIFSILGIEKTFGHSKNAIFEIERPSWTQMEAYELGKFSKYMLGIDTQHKVLKNMNFHEHLSGEQSFLAC